MCIRDRYEAEKAAHGGDRKSSGAKSSSQSANLVDSTKTCDRIAEENGAVSYTHLDVYKRQGYKCWLTKHNLKIMAQTVKLLQEKGLTDEDTLSQRVVILGFHQ